MLRRNLSGQPCHAKSRQLCPTLCGPVVRSAVKSPSVPSQLSSLRHLTLDLQFPVCEMRIINYFMGGCEYWSVVWSSYTSHRAMLASPLKLWFCSVTWWLTGVFFFLFEFVLTLLIPSSKSGIAQDSMFASSIVIWELLPIFIYQSIQRRNFRVFLNHPFLCHMDLVSHQVFLNGFLVYCFWYSSSWVHVLVVSSLLRSRDGGRTISVHPPVSGYLGFFPAFGDYE